MRLLRQLSLLLTLGGSLFGQIPGMTLPPSGNNQKATVSQNIGPVQIGIEYSSPSVHGADGKDRRGGIWGKLVPFGMVNLGFGNGKPSPWRAGANENTVFAASNDVMIEGKRLPAGRYGLHMIPGSDEWTLIFSKNADSWGSFFYEESEDTLRVQVKPHKHEYREWLAYEFPVRKPDETVAEMQWEDLAVPFTVKVEDIDAIYMTRIRHDLTSMPGFNYEGYVAAVQYCLKSGKHLDQALVWADAAISQPFIGKANYETLSTKSLVLTKLGREAEAKKTIEAALRLPGTTPIEIHQYGRQLLNDKKNDEALAVFKLNAERNGDVWPTHVGLARGYAAVGDKPQALEHAKKALEQAPDDLNKNALREMVKTLSVN